MPELPVRAYAIYDQRDEDLFKKLSRHLMPLIRQKQLILNSPGSALAGDRLDAQIESLKEYDLLLVLLSCNLLASDDAYAQVERAMALRSLGIRVVPILASPVDITRLPLAKLAPLPRNGRAVTDWKNSDAALQEIVRGLREVLEAAKLQPQPASEPPAPSQGSPLPRPSDPPVLPSESPPSRSEELDWNNPSAVTKAAIAAVPVMKYALGATGLAAVVAIVTRGFGLDPATATVGPLIVLQSSQVAVGRVGSPRRRACSEPARRAANEVWTYFWSRSLKDQAVRPLQRSSREFFSQPDGGFLRSLVLALMAVLIVFAAMSQHSQHLVLPSIVATWAYLAMTLGTSFLLLASLFFRWPRPLRCLINDEQCASPQPQPSPLPLPSVSAMIDLPVDSKPSGATVWTADNVVFCKATPCFGKVPAHAPLKLYFEYPGREYTFATADPSVDLKKGGVVVSLPPRKASR